MSLIQEIKQNQLIARKAKQISEARLLTTLLGEAAMVGKTAGNRESTDDEVVAVIKKFIKNNNEVMVVSESKSETYMNAIIETDILTQYLPTQMTEEELRLVIQKRIATLEEISPKLMGKVMGWLKQNHNGQYDGKMASNIVKDLLH